MQHPAQSPPSAHKLACLRRIIEGSGVEREADRRLPLDVVEAYLRLSGADAQEFEQVLQQPENEGIRQTMKTWTEQQQEIGEAHSREIGKEIGRKLKAQEDVLRILDALLVRTATAATLAEAGLV